MFHTKSFEKNSRPILLLGFGFDNLRKTIFSKFQNYFLSRKKLRKMLDHQFWVMEMGKAMSISATNPIGTKPRWIHPRAHIKGYPWINPPPLLRGILEQGGYNRRISLDDSSSSSSTSSLYPAGCLTSPHFFFRSTIMYRYRNSEDES